MSESSDHAAGNGDKAVNGAEKPSRIDLPVVTAPHISGDDAQEYEARDEAADEARDEAADESADEPVDQTASAAAAQAAPAQSRRFLMLAATLAFAAAFGSFVGSVSGSGLVQFFSPTRPAAATTDNTIVATQQMKAELAEITAIDEVLRTRPAPARANIPRSPTGSINSTAARRHRPRPM